jgi:UDP-N-acetylmuramoyl-tripeptide--D-alanyl-D-alanine ligase
MSNTQQLYELFLQHPFVSTDTRNDVSNTIFFALSGENFNGNKFAEQALKKGAALAVIDDKEYLKGENYFLVEDVLTALQTLARHHRKENKIPLLGITGSNGKTTTKELISAVLGSSKNIISTRGNLNNHIGVPLTILTIKPETEIAVVEMGANHIGEIELLCKMAKPDVGLITNIGKAHLEGFGSLEGVIRAKNELYQSLKSSHGQALVNADDELLMRLSSELNRITYGTTKANTVGKIISLNPFLTLSWTYFDKEYILPTQLYGKYNFANVMAAVTAGIHFGIAPEKINMAISNYIPENNRSQQINTTTNKIILDAYNANPVSMTEAITSFSEAEFDNPFLILGDMFELGKAAKEEHQKIIQQLSNVGFQNVLLIGKEFFRSSIPKQFTVLETTEDAKTFLQKNSIKKATILIKGSRGMQLETLLNFL